MGFADARARRNILLLFCLGLVLQGGGIVASVFSSDTTLEKPFTGLAVTDQEEVRTLSFSFLIVSSFVGSTVIMILLYKKLESIFRLAAHAKASLVKEIQNMSAEQKEALAKAEGYYTDEMKEIVMTRNMLLLKYLENENKRKRLHKKP